MTQACQFWSSGLMRNPMRAHKFSVWWFFLVSWDCLEKFEFVDFDECRCVSIMFPAGFLLFAFALVFLNCFL